MQVHLLMEKLSLRKPQPRDRKDMVRLADVLVAPNATADYTQRVYEGGTGAGDYDPYYGGPGVDHCGGGLEGYPGDGLKSVIAWVDKDSA